MRRPKDGVGELIDSDDPVATFCDAESLGQIERVEVNVLRVPLALNNKIQETKYLRSHSSILLSCLIVQHFKISRFHLIILVV